MNARYKMDGYLSDIFTGDHSVLEDGKNKKLDVIFLGKISGGAGINCQWASIIVILEPSWNP